MLWVPWPETHKYNQTLDKFFLHPFCISMYHNENSAVTALGSKLLGGSVQWVDGLLNIELSSSVWTIFHQLKSWLLALSLKSTIFVLLWHHRVSWLMQHWLFFQISFTSCYFYFLIQCCSSIFYITQDVLHVLFTPPSWLWQSLSMNWRHH